MYSCGGSSSIWRFLLRSATEAEKQTDSRRARFSGGEDVRRFCYSARITPSPSHVRSRISVPSIEQKQKKAAGAYSPDGLKGGFATDLAVDSVHNDVSPWIAYNPISLGATRLSLPQVFLGRVLPPLDPSPPLLPLTRPVRSLHFGPLLRRTRFLDFPNHGFVAQSCC